MPRKEAEWKLEANYGTGIREGKTVGCLREKEKINGRGIKEREGYEFM